MSSPSSAALHEAHGKRGALPAGIQALDARMRIRGPAFPVVTAVGDNLWLHRAVRAAEPGAVLVVGTTAWEDPDPEPGAKHRTSPAASGYWGELLTAAAMRRGLAGLVIDGHVRDREAILGSGFPVFCRGLCIRGTSKDAAAPGALGRPLTIGEVVVGAGDLVVADADGVVVIPDEAAAAVLRRGEALVAEERRHLARIRAGESTLRVLGLEEP